MNLKKITISIVVVILTIIVIISIIAGIIYSELSIPEEKPSKKISMLYVFNENFILIDSTNQNQDQIPYKLLNKLITKKKQVIKNRKNYIIDIRDRGKYSSDDNTNMYSYQISPNIKVHKLEKGSLVTDYTLDYISISKNDNYLWTKKISDFKDILIQDNKDLIFYRDFSYGICARDIHNGELIYKLEFPDDFEDSSSKLNDNRNVLMWHPENTIFLNNYIYFEIHFEVIHYSKDSEVKSYENYIKHYIFQLE